MKLIYFDMLSKIKLIVICGFRNKNFLFSYLIKLFNIYCVLGIFCCLGIKSELWYGFYFKFIVSLVKKIDI